MPDNDSILQNKPKGEVDFAGAMLRNALPGDIYQKELKGFAVPAPDRDSFGKLFEEGTDEALIDQSFATVMVNYDLYKSRNFDPFKTRGAYKQEGVVYSPGFEPKTDWSVPNTAEFIKLGSPTTYITPGGTEIERRHAQQVAKTNGVFKTNEGRLLPLELYNGQDNNLMEAYDKDLKSNIWIEAPDGVIIDPSKIRPAEWLGGPAELESNSWSSGARGAMSGMWSQAIKGVGGTVSLINDGFSALTAIGSSRTFDEIASTSDLHRMAVDLYNFSNYQNRMNTDEQAGIFESWNSFIYQASNGIAQFIPMIATSAGGGALGMLAGKAAAKIGVKQISSQATAAFASKMYGSMVVFGYTSEELERLGYDRSSSLKTAYGFAMGTFASESLFMANINETLGWKIANSYIRKVDQQSVLGITKKIYKNSAKRKVLVDGIEKKISTGSFGHAIGKGEKMRLMERFGRMRRELFSLGDDSPLIKTILFAAGEESIEEGLEGVFHQKIAQFFNEGQKEIAYNNMAIYGGMKIERMGPGLYHAIYRNGRIESIDLEEKLAIEKTRKLTDAVLDGSALLDEDFNYDEMVIAGLAAGLTGGPLTHMTHKRNKKNKRQLFAMGLAVSENPTKISEVDKVVDQWINMGMVNEDEANGYTNEDGEYVRGIREDVKESVQLMADQIKLSGITDPKVMEILGQNVPLMQELYDNMQHDEKLTSAIAALETVDDNAPPEDIKAAMAEHVDGIMVQEGDKIDVLKERQKEIRAKIASLGTVKKTPDGKTMTYNDSGTEVEAKTSERYTERMNRVATIEAAATAKARELAGTRSKWKKWFNEKTLGKKYEAGRRIAYIDRQKKAIMNDLTKLTQLRIAGLNTDEPYVFLKEVIENHLPKIGAQIEKNKNRVIKGQKLTEEELIQTQDDMDRVDELLNEEVEFEIEGEKDAEGKTTKTTGKMSLNSILNDIKTKGIEASLKEITNNGTLIANLAEIGENMVSLSNSFNKDFLPYRGELKGKFNATKGLFDKFFQFDLARTAHLEKDLEKDEKPVLTKDDEEINETMDQIFGGDVGDAIRLLRETFDGLKSEDVGVFEETIDVKPIQTMDEIDNQAMNNMLRALFKDPVLAKFFESYVDNEVGAVLTLLSNLEVDNKQFGLVYLELREMFNDEKGQFEDPEAVLDSFIMLGDALAQIETYVDLMEVTLNQLHNKKELREHAVTSPKQNRDKLIDQYHLDQLKGFLTSLRESIAVWGEDQRLADVTGKNAEYKTRVAYLANRISSLNYIYRHKDLDLSEKDGEKLSTILEQVDQALKNQTKDFGKNQDNNEITISAEALSIKYFSLKDAQLKRDLEVFTARLEGKIDQAEEILAGKVDKVLKTFKKEYKRDTLNLEVFQEVLFNSRSSSVDGYFSNRTFNNGLTNYNRAVSSNAELFEDSIPQEADHDKALKETDFFVQSVLSNLIMLQTFGVKVGKKRLPTKRQVLKSYNTIVGDFKGTTRPLETWEQINQLLELVAMHMNQEDSPTANRKNDSYPNSILLGGYAGTGKSDVSSIILTVLLHKLYGKKMNVVVIVPTQHLKKDYRDREKEIIAKYGKDAVSFEYIYLDKLSVDNKVFKNADLIFAEEVSMYSDYDEDSDMGIIADIQQKHKNKMVLIGDDGQVGVVDSDRASNLVFNNTRKATTLSHIFRTGITSLFLLQEKYRNWVNEDTLLNAATSSFKKYENGDKAGIQYVARSNAKEEVVAGFIEARKNKKDAILIVPTYEMRQNLIDQNKDLEDFSAYIKTLEHDTVKIRANKDLRDLNVSGMAADEVYIPFAPDEIINGGPNIDQIYSWNGFDYEDGDVNGSGMEHIAAANKMVLSATSRSKRFVMMGMANGSSENLTGTDSIIPGYVDVKTKTEEEKTAEEEEKKKELTPKQLRNQRIKDVNERIGGVKTYNYSGKDVDDVTDDKAKTDTDDDGSGVKVDDTIVKDDQPESPEPDPVDEDIIEPVSPDKIIVGRTDDVVKVIHEMEEAAVKIRAGRTTQNAENVTDSIYEKAFGPGNKTNDNLSQLRGITLSAALKVVMQGDNVTKTTLLAYEDALNNYFQASKKSQNFKPETYEKYRSGLSEHILQTMSEIKFDEQFANDGMFIGYPSLQVSGKKGIPFAMKIVGIDFDTQQPIVDIYVIASKKENQGTLKKFDPKKINREKLAAYAALAIKKGYQVNQLKMIQVIDDYTGSFSQGTTFTLADKEASNLIYDASIRIFGKDISPGDKLVDMEGLYSHRRYVDEAPAFGMIVSAGDSFVDNKTLTNSFIQEIKLVFDVGSSEWFYFYDVIDSNGKVTEYSQKKLEKAFRPTRFSKEQEMFQSNAIAFKKAGHVFSSTVVIPTGAKIPKKKFWSKTNPWLKRKRKVTRWMVNSGIDQLDKVYINGFEFFRPDVNGALEPVTQNHALVNMLSPEQVEKAAKFMKMSVATFTKEGLHIVSIDGQPELGFKKTGKDNKVITGQNEMAVETPGLFESAIKGTVNPKTLKKAIEKSFASEEDGDTRKALVDFQLHKIKMLQLGYKAFLTDPTEVVVEIGKVFIAGEIVENRLMLSGANQNKISGKKLIDNLTDQGFRYIGTFQAGKDNRDRVRFNMQFEDENKKPINIIADARPFASKEEFHKYITDAIKELDNKDSAFGNLVAQYDKLVQPELDDQKAMTKWENQRIRIMKKMYPIFMENKANALLLHNKRTISVMLTQKVRSIHRRISISTSTDKKKSGLNIKGYTMTDRIRLLKQQISDMRNLDHTKFYVPIFIPSKIDQDGNFAIDPVNLTTRVLAVLQPQIYTSKELIGYDTSNVESDEATIEHSDEGSNIINDNPDDETEMFHVSANAGAYTFIAEKDAMQQLLDILGPEIFKSLNIDREQVFNKGQRAFGHVAGGAIWLTSINGQVESTTPRHEAMHYILEYLMDDKTQKKVFDRARFDMVREGLANNRNDISYKQIHEWLAKKYGEQNYLGDKAFDTSTFWGKILEFFRQVLLKFSIETGRNAISETFARADQGYYATDINRIDNTGEAIFYNTAENEFNDITTIEAIDTVFNGWETANDMRDRFIMPHILLNSKYGKSIRLKNSSAGFKGSSPNHFNKAVKITLENIIVMNDENEDLQFSYIDKNGVTQKNLTFEDLTIENFVKAVDGEKAYLKDNRTATRVNNTEFKKAYFFKILNEGFEYITTDGEEEAAIRFSGEKILLSLLQNKLPGLDLSKIKYDEYNGGMVSTSQLLMKLNKETVNPMNSLSAFIKFLIGQVPYRIVKTGTDTVVGTKINSKFADKIFLDVAAELRSRGWYPTNENFFNILQEFANLGSSSVYRNTAYSLSVFFGNTITIKQQNQIDGVDGAINLDGLIHDTSSLISLDGIGYMTLAGKSRAWLEHHLKISKSQAEDIIRKQPSFRHLSNALVDHYVSLTNTVHFKLVNNGRGNLRVVRSRSLDKTHTNSRIIDGTQAAMFNQADSFLKKQARELFVGNDRKYDVKKDGLYLKDSNGKFKKIIGIDGFKGTLPTNLTKREQVVLVQEYLNDIFPNQRISQSAVVGILKVSIGSKTFNASAVSQMYFMAKLLKKTSIDSVDWYALGVGGIFKQSKESLALQHELDIYISQTKDVANPNVQTATRKEDRKKTEKQIVVYSHLQFQGFIHDLLSEQITKQQGNSASRTAYTVDGKRRYAFGQTSTLTDSFPNSGFENPSTQVMAKSVKNDAQDALEAGNLDALKVSPIVTLKAGKLTYNDPIINGSITFDYIAEYDGSTSPWFASSSKKLTHKSYLQGLMNLTKIALKKNHRVLPAFLDTQSDRSKISMVNWVTGKLFTPDYTKEGDLVKINVAAKQFVKIAQDFVRFAHRRAAISGKDAMKHNSYYKVPLAPFEAAIKKGEYKVAMEMVTKAFDAEYAEYLKSLEDFSITDEGARTVESGKFDEIAIIDALKSFGFKTDFFESEFNDLRDALDGGRGITSGELLKIKGRMFGALKRMKITDPEYDAKNSDFYKETMKPLGELFDKLIPKGATKTREVDEIMKVVFWSHNFVNNSVNHLVRGDVPKFKDFIDYIKRGSGLDATGSTYNRDIIGRQHRVLLVKDIPFSNELFDGDVLATDGVRFINPVIHYLFAMAKGADLGTISFSAQKNVQYDYNPIGDVLNYFKMSDVPINFSVIKDKFYVDLLQTMFGPKLWNKHVAELGADHQGFKSVMAKIGNQIISELKINDGISETLNQMVSIVAHTETQKAEQKNVQSYTTTTDEDGIVEYSLDTALNSDDKINIVPTDNLRLQQVAGGFMEGKKRPVLSQQDNINSAGWWNRDIADKINTTLKTRVDDKEEVVDDNMHNPRMMSDDIVSKNRTKGGSYKLYRIANTETIDVNTYKLKAIQSQIVEMNNALKPKVPGNSVIQTPYMGFVYELNGQVYTSQFLDRDQVDNYKDHGMTKRRLAPIQFIADGKIIKTQEELFKTPGARVIPQEIQMPFTYAVEFGISYGRQPQNIMMTGSRGNRKNWMSKRTEEKHLSVKTIYDGMAEYLDLDGSIFLHAFDSDVQNYIIGKLLKEGVIDRPTDFEDTDLTYFHNDGAVQFEEEVVKNEFVKKAAQYMRLMNLSLDVFAARIPGTNASTGFPSRIVGFLWDSDNTVLYSPEKNILDGSDNDIDELHVMNQSLVKGTKAQKELAKSQNNIFKGLWSYYNKAENFPLIMQKVGPERLRALAEKYPSKSNLYEANVNTSAKEREINMSGTGLIGHFANLQTILLRMMQIGPAKRKKMFGKINAVINKNLNDEVKNSPLLDNTPESLMVLIDTTSILINAATDNSKLGGVLGRIGINERTSNLVAGFVAAGYGLEDIAAILNDKEVAQFLIDNREATTQMHEVLDASVGEESSDIMKQLLEASIIGEQLRRMTEIVRLQQGIGTEYFSLYQKKSNFQKYFGQDSLQDVNDILQQGDRRIFEDDGTVESRVLSSINLFDVINELPLLKSYINIINTTYNYVNEQFSITAESKVFKTLEGHTKHGVITKSNEFKTVMHELDRLLLGRYLDTMTGIQIGDKTYNFSDIQKRYEFIVDSVEHMKAIKERNAGNAFTRAFDYDAGSMGIPIYKFSDNLNKDDLEKGYYATEFERLSDVDKDFFRTYQALVYGFQYTTGSFYEMMDDVFEQQYSNWLETVDVDEILNDPKNIEEIVGRTSGFLTDHVNKPYSKETDTFGNFRSRTKLADGTVMPVSIPYPHNFNSHGKRNTAYHMPVLSDLNYNQKYTKEFNEVKTNGLNRFRDFQRQDASIFFTDVFSGDSAVSPNGIILVHYNAYNSISVKKIANLNTSPKIKVKNSRVRTYGISGNVLNDLLTRLARAFPNIKVELVNDSNTPRNGVSGWMGDGIIYLNTDLIQADTPFHEYSHIVLGILKASNPDIYFDLLKMASALVNNNDPLAVSIYDLYPELNVNDRLEEVIAGILGIQNAEIAEEKYIGLIGKTGKVVGKRFWVRVESLLKRAWESFKSVIKSAFGVPKMSDNFNSIEEFGQKLNAMVNRGEVITSLSSAEFTHLVGSFTKDSRIGKITNIGGLLEHIDNPKNSPNFEKISRNNRAAGIINTIKNFKGIVPSYVYGRPIVMENYSTLKVVDKGVQDIVSQFVNNDKQQATKFINILSGAFEPDGYFTVTDKQAFLNEAYDVRKGGNPVVTVAQFNDLLKGLDFNADTKYMSLAAYNKKKGLSLDLTGMDNVNLMVAVEHSKKDREVISLYPITTESPAIVHSFDGSTNIMGVFNVDDRKANTRGVGIKNTIMGKSSIAVGYLSSAISKKNPNIKVRSAALLRPVFSRKTYYGIDLGRISRELKGMTSFDELKEYMSPEMIETLNKTSAASFNWGIYLDSLNKDDDKQTPFPELPLNDQLTLINKRIRELIEKVAMGQDVTQEDEQELQMLSEYYTALNNGQMTDKTVNSHSGKINSLTRYIYDQNAIGEHSFNILRQSILNSSNKIVRESNEYKERLSKIHKKILALTGVDIVQRSASNQAKAVWGSLFDTIIDSEDNQRRTGMIYWSNNLADATNDTERALIIRAKERGVSDEMLAIGKEYMLVIEDLMLENITHQKRLREKGNKNTWTRKELLEELYTDSSYSKGFIPMMGANVSELTTGGKFAAAGKKQLRQILDMTTLMNEIPDYATVEKGQDYITRIRDMMFKQVGYHNVSTGYTPFGSSERMKNLMGLQTMYDVHGNLQWNTTNAIYNDNASFDIENMLDYFTVSTKRVTIHEEQTLPIINAIKYGLNIKANFKNLDTETLISHINDYVDTMVLGVRKDETRGAKVGIVKVGNVLEVINSIARPIIMALNPNIAILSGASNFMLSLTEAVSNSLAGTTSYGVKEMAAATAVYNTDKKKASRVARYYQVINQTEFDLLHHYTSKTVDKNLLSSFGSNYLNWYVDNSARTIVMIAQMMKDGAWDAHSIDKDGNVLYDANKDDRFSDRKKNKKQNVLYEFVQSRAVAEGYDYGTRAYDFQESRKFKILSERKVTGAFGAESRSVLNNYVLGRSAMMFSSWFVSRLSDAFGASTTSKEGGRWIIEMIEGKEVPVWEEVFIEGYMVTMSKTLAKIFTFNWDEVNKLSPDEKKNMIKAISVFATYFLILGMYKGLQKLGEEDPDYAQAADIAKLRAIRNVMIAANGMVILPGIFEKFDSPFAGPSIIARGFISAYGGFSWSNLKNIIIFKRTYDFFDDPIELATGESIWGHMVD